MKKIVRLTESELKNIVEKSVRRAIKEGAVDESTKGKLAAFAAGAALGLGAPKVGKVAYNNLKNQKHNIEVRNQANPEDKEEMAKTKYINNFKKDLSDQGVDTSNIHYDESRIRRAVMESIMNLMKE